MRSSQLAPGQKEVRLSNESFIVDSAVDLDLVKVEFAPGDALVLASRGTGVIRRVEIDTRTQDGIKVQNADAQAAHDLVIGQGVYGEGGYVKGHGKEAAAHQDGIQVMGGARLTFRGLHIESMDTQGVFVNKAGSGATNPTDIVIEDCFVTVDESVTDGPATPININGSLRTVVRGCKVCKSKRFGRGLVVGSGAVDETIQDNTEFPVGQCPEVPDPDPEPEPDPDSLPLHVVSQDASTITFGWTPPSLGNLLGYRFSREKGGGKFSHTWDPNRNTVKFSKDSAWYRVDALLLGPWGDQTT